MGFFEKAVDKIAYGNDPELVHNKNKNDFNKLTFETICSSIGLLLIQGTFQTKLLLKLGADINQISLLSSLILAAGLSCLFGGGIFNRLKKRKMLVLLLQTVPRLIMSMLCVVPLILPQSAYPAYITVYIVVTVLCYACVSMGTVGYESFMAALTDKRLRGRFMASRNLMYFVLTPLSPVIGALILDKTEGSWFTFAAYGLVCSALLIFSGSVFLSVNEPNFEVNEKKKISLKDLLKDIKMQKAYMLHIGEMFLFYMFLYICGTFTSTYLNSSSYLGLSAFLVEMLTFGLCIAKTLLVRFVGRLNDRFSSEKMLYFCQLLFGIEMLSWAVLPPSLLPALIFVPYLFQSLSNVTSAICSYPRKFDICPKENTGFYLGLYGFTISIAYFVGPWIGRKLLALLTSSLSESALASHWEIRLTYLIAAALIFTQKLIQLIIKRKPEV